ncbi:MAG TPA: porin [Bryobacteraceae bacterium]|nr:porin [Bryobacteraceae bacterium]
MTAYRLFLRVVVPALLVVAGAQNGRAADGSEFAMVGDDQTQVAQNQVSGVPPDRPPAPVQTPDQKPQTPGTRYENAGQNIPITSEGIPRPGVPLGATDVPTFNVLGRVKLHLTGYLQPRYTQQPGTNSVISIKRARLVLDGSLDKKVDFYFQFDPTLSPALLDAYINLKPKDWLKFRVGQFKVGFSEESLLGDDLLVPVERSVVVNKFSPDRDISAQGRDLGAQAYGSFIVTKRSLVDYWVGVFDGGGIYNIAPNHHKAWVARVIAHPIKGLNVGGDYYEGKTGTPPAALVAKQRADLELGYQHGRFYSYSEYLFGRDGLVHRSGGYGLLAYRFVKELDAFARYEEYNAQHDKAHQIARIYMAGVNYYPVKLLKFGADYGVLKDPASGKLGSIALAQLQAGW